MTDQIVLHLGFLPVSLKNSARQGQGRRFRGDRGGGARPDHQIVSIKASAVDAVCRARSEGAPANFGPNSSLWGAADVACSLVEFPRERRCRVTFRRLGPKPEEPTGRAKDLGNMDAIIHDAVQGILYDDDRQLVEISSRRLLGDAPSIRSTPEWDERTALALLELWNAVQGQKDTLGAIGVAGQVLQARGLI